MIKDGTFLYKLCRNRFFSACPLPLESQGVTFSLSAAPQSTHKDLCFSLVEQLIRRGLSSSAQKVIRRLISQCSYATEAISVVDFAVGRGLDLDLVSYGCLVRKLVVFGEALMAEALYRDFVVGKGLEPDRELLNSMVICFCKLGKLDEAKSCFDRLIEKVFVPAAGVCNAIVKSFCFRDRYLESYDCFFKIVEASEIVLEFTCYNRLVSGLCSRGFLDEGLHVFDVLIDRGLPPTANMCRSLIIGFSKWDRAEEAEILSTEIELYGFVVDKLTYTYLINAYCKGRKMKMAMRLFMRMLKMGCAPDTYTYNTLIYGFLNLGMFSKGWLLYNKMVDSGLKPNLVTYQIMLNKYCIDQKVDSALMLFNDMLHSNMTPNIHCYTVLIAALFREQRLEEVYSLYHEMLANEVVPDPVLFFTLVKHLPERDEMYLALMVLQPIAKASCDGDGLVKSHSVKPISTTDAMVQIECLLDEITRSNSFFANTAYSIYIIALCVGRRLDTALDFVEKMVNRGLSPSHTAFNSLIKLLFQEGLTQDAQSVLEFMQHQGVVANQTTFSIIVNEYCKHADSSSAINVLEQIEERGIKPSVAIYNSIIDCLGRQKMIHEAEKFFFRMLDFGIDPDEKIFVTMINAYSKNGCAKLADRLFKQMMEYDFGPSSHAYTALIAGLVKKNMINKCCIYLDKMLEEGLTPNAVLYTSLVKQFLKKKEFEFAFRLVDLMEKSEIEHDLVSSITLVSGFSRNFRYYERNWFHSDNKSKKAKEMLFHLLHQKSIFPRAESLKVLISSKQEMKLFALRLIQKIREVPILQDLYLYNSRILGLCREQRMQEAHEHLNLMQKKGVHPNIVTFTILIDGHMKVGEVDLAVALFNKMNSNGFAKHGLDGVLFNTLVKGLCKGGRIIDALSLSHNMQKRGFFPSKSSYETLLSSFCAQRSSSNALKIYEDMLAHDYFPCRYNFEWLINILCEDTKLQDDRVSYTKEKRNSK
ncbi:pentatricopeptide repeat-containing protein-like [Dorcoceras hygrometricum]|uniref:Pentatricopeptide repeat-containing protein-like n=1 Tax=Dorcoceras hygrometricum TaxID=472368 RepID=A0A2Z7B6K2_9LAMI|nr:pentatricopeptide repeat-containing protein-like [Dorcoceras hygrometricum]